MGLTLIRYRVCASSSTQRSHEKVQEARSTGFPRMSRCRSSHHQSCELGHLWRRKKQSRALTRLPSIQRFGGGCSGKLGTVFLFCQSFGVQRITMFFLCAAHGMVSCVLLVSRAIEDREVSLIADLHVMFDLREGSRSRDSSEAKFVVAVFAGTTLSTSIKNHSAAMLAHITFVVQKRSL